MNKLMQTVTENVAYVVIFLAVIVGCFLMAVVLEKSAQKKNGVSEPIFNTRKLAMIGMFSAIAMILHVLDFPIFFAPGFYKMDFSELPILVGSFAFGPVAGVMMEFVKILLKLCIKGTSTAFIGDLANFVVGCSLIIPASAVYSFKKTKKKAILACIAGTLVMTDIWHRIQCRISASRVLQVLRNASGCHPGNGYRGQSAGKGRQHCKLRGGMCGSHESHQGNAGLCCDTAHLQAFKPYYQNRS